MTEPYDPDLAAMQGPRVPGPIEYLGLETSCFSLGCEYLDIIPAEIVVVQQKDPNARLDRVYCCADADSTLGESHGIMY